MSVGLPGTGVGSAFYLVAALWSPVREAFVGTDPDRRRRARGVALLALGIIGAVVAATWAIAILLPQANVPLVRVPGEETGSDGLPLGYWLAILLLSPFGTLVAVLGLVNLARVFSRRSGRNFADPLAFASGDGEAGAGSRHQLTTDIPRTERVRAD